MNILCENDAKPKVNDIYQSAEKMMVGSITERGLIINLCEKDILEMIRK